MTIYSLEVLLFLFGTSLLFHVQFELLLPDLHTNFSRGRSGGLVFPSLSEFSTVYCDPHSQRLWQTYKLFVKKRIKLVSGSWIRKKIFIKSETLIFWPPDAKSWLTGKDSDAGKDWGQEEKGMREDEMVGWHHQPDGHGFGCTLGVGDGQGGLACCGSWGHKESDTTERLNWNWTELICISANVVKVK